MESARSVINRWKVIIATSLCEKPGTEEELYEREAFKRISFESLQRIIMRMEFDAIRYEGEVLHINEDWAKENLKNTQK